MLDATELGLLVRIEMNAINEVEVGPDFHTAGQVPTAEAAKAEAPKAEAPPKAQPKAA